eukprot:TRINITY_DN28957_c0_g1_i6.p1 TRINITY_DN28957_c0_g1~~TRINITY_DN28957_c0_g1_i6.p1  ORF type:complete len:255 (+),score=49.14 TRINITY_DN28957_c0_g1_i6:73-837(+)
MAFTNNTPYCAAGHALYPGSLVEVRGLHVEAVLNGRRGICQAWDPEELRIHVRIDGDRRFTKALKLMHVRKVVEETKKEATESASADLASAKAMFSDYDKNGDGVLDRQELSQVLEDLGIDARCIDYFLRDLDKNNDGVVSYEEFLNWVCKDLMEESPAEADDGCASPRARPVVDRLTTADLAQCLSLPSDWPVDGTPLFNTMHMRFPHCTFSTIVSELQRQKYDGALVIKALKASGAVEAEALSETAEISQSF